MADIFKSAFGEVQLSIHPDTRNRSLRPWDAADEYLLNHLAELNLPNKHQRIFIFNDRYGALTTSLAAFSVTSISDSYISQLSTHKNLRRNNCLIEEITWLNSLQTPTGLADIVLLKIPVSLALLEDQLIRLKHCVNTHTVILAAGMSKFIHTSTLELFNRILGTTRTSLARKKSRLIFLQMRPIATPH